MSWTYPLSASQITGKGLLTKDKPLTRVHNAIHEIQEKAVTDADIDIDGITVTDCFVNGNVLTIRGVAAKSGPSVSSPFSGSEGGGTGAGGSSGGGEGGGADLEALAARVAALEAKLSGVSIEVNLELNDGLDISGAPTWGDGGRVEISGSGVGVSTCDDGGHDGGGE